MPNYTLVKDDGIKFVVAKVFFRCLSSTRWAFYSRRGAVVKGRRTYFDKFGAGSSTAGSISRDLNSQKLQY